MGCFRFGQRDVHQAYLVMASDEGSGRARPNGNRISGGRARAGPRDRPA